MNIKKIGTTSLIISAHADDHILCAGTIIKLREEKYFDPYEIVLTDFSQGQDFRKKTFQTNEEIKSLRLNELSNASKFLGIKKTYLLNQPDFGLKPTYENIHQVAEIIREVKPEVVFLMGESDTHPDHKAAYRIGIEAVKLASYAVKINSSKPHRVPIVLCNDQEMPTKIHFVVDITKYVNKKRQLFSIYSSQMSPKEVAHQRGIMSVRGYYLSNSEHLKAEAFSLQNEFPNVLFENEY